MLPIFIRKMKRYTKHKKFEWMFYYSNISELQNRRHYGCNCMKRLSRSQMFNYTAPTRRRFNFKPSKHLKIRPPPLQRVTNILLIDTFLRRSLCQSQSGSAAMVDNTGLNQLAEPMHVVIQHSDSLSPVESRKRFVLLKDGCISRGPANTLSRLYLRSLTTGLPVIDFCLDFARHFAFRDPKLYINKWCLFFPSCQCTRRRWRLSVTVLLIFCFLFGTVSITFQLCRRVQLKIADSRTRYQREVDRSAPTKTLSNHRLLIRPTHTCTVSVKK